MSPRPALLRFVALGALLFALDLARPPAPAPDGAALDDDALLVREALARELHLHDDVVRRRLVRNLRFARPEDARSDDALVAEAFALGLHESDLVVRRRLAQKMRLLFAARARSDEPSDAELRAWLASHTERFTEPERIALTQLYFRERRAAEAALAALAPLASEREEAPAAGEPLPLPHRLPPHARAELAARLGPGFADAAFTGPEGRWFGPLASSYGHHLVFVRERTPARRSDLASVRSALREAVLSERAEAATRREIAALRGGR